jgi:hypothetical protein
MCYYSSTKYLYPLNTAKFSHFINLKIFFHRQFTCLAFIPWYVLRRMTMYSKASWNTEEFSSKFYVEEIKLHIIWF